MVWSIHLNGGSDIMAILECQNGVEHPLELTQQCLDMLDIGMMQRIHVS
jgi:hypothetical protein